MCPVLFVPLCVAADSARIIWNDVILKGLHRLHLYLISVAEQSPVQSPRFLWSPFTLAERKNILLMPGIMID